MVAGLLDGPQINITVIVTRRRGQVAKAVDCKSTIAGSNPADASGIGLSGSMLARFFYALPQTAGTLCSVARANELTNSRWE